MANPLVSVIVVTYNSSATVRATLDSIKRQTYKNIELIISDDCSTDNTQFVVKQWLESNNNEFSFKRVFLTNTIENGGPAINCNHGIRNSTGKWLKLIAADDILLPDCIKKNVEYVEEHESAQIVFSKIVCFSENDQCCQIQNDDINWKFWELTNKQQYFLMLLENMVTAPSQFIRKEAWERLGGFDEGIPFIEDWPFWIKAMRKGLKFDFMAEPTVLYRVHDSLSRTKTPSKKYLDSLRSVKEYVNKCQNEISPLYRCYSFVNDKVRFPLLRKFVLIWNPYYWYIKKIHSLME